MVKLTLRQKTWILITAVLVLSIIGVVLLTHYLYERFYIDKQIDLLIARGDLLTELYYEDDQDKEEFLRRVEWMNKCAEANVLFTDDVQYLLGTDGINPRNSLITLDEAKRLQHGETVHIVRSQSSFEMPIMGVAVPLLDDEGCLLGVIFLYKTLVEIFEPFHATRVWILISFIILMLFIILTVRRVMNNITHPLENMRAISAEMAAGDFTQRIEVRSNDEIGSLSNSFNALAAALEREEQKKREFLSNVSHELRTPLSYIKGYTEAILDEMVDDPKRYVNTIHKESVRMQRLVNDLLDLAQLEGDSYPMKKQPLPFAQLIEDVVERFELAAKQKGVTLNKNLDYEAIIMGDEDRLEQVIGNLLDNALRYTASGKEISISLRSLSTMIEFEIADQGQGIPAESLPKIVERFYRVDKGRSRKEGGTGLGLSIVSEIIKKHDGKLEFTSKENEGTTVTIAFPKSL